jgi:hypothetical protein
MTLNTVFSVAVVKGETKFSLMEQKGQYLNLLNVTVLVPCTGQ